MSPMLALQRKVTSDTSIYSVQIDAQFCQSLDGLFSVTRSGGGVVVSGVADVPCGLFHHAAAANPPQGPGAAPGGEGVAN